MSRRKRNGLTRFEELVLNSPTCLLWPNCACHHNLTHWQEALEDTDKIFTFEELEAAETVIFYSCACAAEHCPDREFKLYAARQFANLTLRRERIAAAQQRAEAN
jgi:hypothetical protein